MKKKMFLLVIVILSVLFIGITNVNAYDYKAGDVVEISNSNGESQQFYVVAGKNEINTMIENYCKDVNHNQEDKCKDLNITPVDTYVYSSTLNIDDNAIILISKNPVVRNVVFKNGDSSSNTEDQAYYTENYNKYNYISNMIQNDEILFNYNDLSNPISFYLELLYSTNDDISHDNDIGEKVLLNVPTYLSHYENAVATITGYNNSSTYRWSVSKLINYNNNSIKLVQFSSEDADVSGNMYLTVAMTKDKINLINQSSEGSISNLNNISGNSETSKTNVVENPKTSDVNMLYITFGILVFIGIVIVSAKRIKKFNKVSR